MAKFPIERARQELGFTPVPSVRADIDVRTGEGAVGAAIGRGLLTFGKMYEDTLTQTQLSEFQRRANEEINRLALSFNTNLDPETYRAEYEKSTATIQSLMPKHPRAARSAQLWLNAKEPAWSEDVDKARMNRADDNWMSELFEKQALVGRTGQIGSFPKFLAEGVNAGRVNKSDAVNILAATNKAAVVGQITNLYGAGNYEVAREQTRMTKLLTPRERESILNVIDAEERNSQTQAKLAIKQKDDAIGEEFLGLLANKLDPAKPQLTFGMIEASGLSFGAKDGWFTKLRTFDNYSEGELKEAFIDKGEVLADIYNKIDDGTLTNELDTMVGKGLSPTTAQRIKREVREPYKKDTEQLFKRIFGWSPELGFENELSSFLYEKTLREWEAEVKKQDATGEKIIEIGRSIARPYFLEHLEAVMPSDISISRMMELALGEEIKEEKPTEPIEVKEPEEEIKEVPEPKTQAEYDALPSGTIYIDTDGTRRKKR